VNPGRITVWFTAAVAARLLAAVAARLLAAVAARLLAAVAAGLLAVVAAGPLAAGAAPGAAASPAALTPAGRSLTWENAAAVDNRKDAGNRFQVAFGVENGEGDQLTASNRAVAHADCTACRTVALAFQVGIFTSQAPSVVADNVSDALNETCDACVTFAAAQQFLLVTDRPLRLSRAGQWRLAAVRLHLRRLAASRASTAEIQQALPGIETEVIDILTSQARLAHRHAVLRYRQGVCDVPGHRHDRARVQLVS
jgi:putative peptide zinc metalloprotease protein